MSHKDKVKIVVRVASDSRNNSLNDSSTPSPNCALHVFPFTNQIILAKSLAKKPFVFDYVFNESATQLDVFNNLESGLIPKIFEGCDATLLIYGQKGSGKWYTMFGDSEGKERGIVPRLFDEVFKRISTDSNEWKGENEEPNTKFTIEISYMEIYNEKIYDLTASNKVPLKVREHSNLGAFVDGLSQSSVTSSKGIDQLMTEKYKNCVGGNYSHIITTLTLTKTSSSAGTLEEQSSKFSVVDLAPLPSPSNDSGKQTKEEIANLNKSLSALGFVISKLAEGKSFIPYRDSVLTWLLKDHLEGNSRLTMIATISASSDHTEETLSTLRYAERAKKIVCNPMESRNVKVSMIRDLKKEVKQLKDKLQKQNSEAEMVQIETQSDDLSLNNNLQQEDLKRMGISVEQSGIQVEKDSFYLVNLSQTPSPDELLVYYLNKHKTKVGRPDGAGPPDIQLSTDGIKSQHCEFVVESDGNLCIIPYPDSCTYVNGVLLKSSRNLRHGDNIQWGSHCELRLHTPVKNRFTSLPVVVQSDSCGIVSEKEMRP